MPSIAAVQTMIGIVDGLGDLLIEYGERIVIDRTIPTVGREPVDRLMNDQSTSDLFEERRRIMFGETRRLTFGLVRRTHTCRVSDRFQSGIVRRYPRHMVS